MINRVLIRIKVVQLLYSYFLVQNNFSVQSSPAAPTKEKRFAYSLYLDYLYLMIRIADSVRKSDHYPLADTRFIQRMSSDNIIRSIKNKYAVSFPLSPAVDGLADAIADSAVFKRYLTDPLAEPTIWSDIFRLFIYPSPVVGSLVEKYESYSSRGVDRAKDMIEETMRELASSQDNISEGIADLKVSLNKARELYFRLLLLPVELTYQQEVDLEERRCRYNRTEEDLNPNPKFIDNELVKLLAADEEIRGYVENGKISWLGQDRDMVRHLLRKILASPLYAEYMADPTADLHEDCEFWKKAMRHIIFTDPEFIDLLESKSVFWNDDLDIIGEFVIKTFRRFEDKASDPECKLTDPVLPMYKDAEDAEFGPELFEATVKRSKIYRDYINEVLNTRHWESDRLAYMDVIIMITALAEICTFPKIPVQASLNEYIEIAKSYSSAKSGSFINGLLAGVIANLRETGKLKK